MRNVVIYTGHLIR